MEKINLDNLSSMSDNQVENLCKKASYIISTLRRAHQRNKSEENLKALQQVEIEYCYIFRESEVRSTRKKMHEAYLAKLRENKFKESKNY